MRERKRKLDRIGAPGNDRGRKKARPRMSELHLIACPPNRTLNVVFVHGLGGHWANDLGA
jgi:hypothetical protein